MTVVKRVEAHALTRELRDYAFTESLEFADSRASGLELARTLYYDQTGNNAMANRLSRRLSFHAFRLSSMAQKRPGYGFSISCVDEQPIPEVLPLVYKNLRKKQRQRVDETAPYGIRAAREQSYSLDTFEPRAINYNYALLLNGKTLFETSTDDLLFSVPGDFVEVPPEESLDYDDEMFVPHRIKKDSLKDPVEQCDNDRRFEEIVRPYVEDGGYDHETYREHAAEIRAILAQLATGRILLNRPTLH